VQFHLQICGCPVSTFLSKEKQIDLIMRPGPAPGSCYPLIYFLLSTVIVVINYTSMTICNKVEQATIEQRQSVIPSSCSSCCRLLVSQNTMRMEPNPTLASGLGMVRRRRRQCFSCCRLLVSHMAGSFMRLVKLKPQGPGPDRGPDRPVQKNLQRKFAVL